jgi:MarR family transcriptional regulator, transcriptional regulator for hemolysin
MLRRNAKALAQTKQRRRKPRSKKTDGWLAGVSADGDLFLRRTDEEGAASTPVHYSFSQGLAFVARRWRNVMNDALLTVGQSHVRWGTLYWITVFGDRVNQTQLAKCMGIEQQSLGHVLHDLEADGLIQRRAPKGDRRARVIALTSASKPLMKKINGIQNEVRAALVRDISKAELAACLTVFAKILRNADQLSEVEPD